MDPSADRVEIRKKIPSDLRFRSGTPTQLAHPGMDVNNDTSTDARRGKRRRQSIYNDSEYKMPQVSESMSEMPNHKWADRNDILTFSMDTPDVKRYQRKTCRCCSVRSHLTLTKTNSDWLPCSEKVSHLFHHSLYRTKAITVTLYQERKK